jgi:predicted transcriptional regulator
MSFSSRGFDWMAFVLGFLFGALFIGVIVTIILFPEALPGLTFFGGGLLAGLLFAGAFWILDRQRNLMTRYRLMNNTSSPIPRSSMPKSKTNHTDLTELELDVLTTVKQRHSISQSELVRILNIPRSTISETLRDLEEKGLIFREKRGRTYEIHSNRG